MKFYLRERLAAYRVVWLLALGIIILTLFVFLVLDRPAGAVQYAEWKTWDSPEEFVSTFNGGVSVLAPDACLDVAQMIQEANLNWGYKDVNIAWSLHGYYYGKWVSKVWEGHAGILLETKQGWYFIDPVDWRITYLAGG